MKPDWEELMADFKDHASTVVADVDCTAEGKELCNEIGVRGYPTIKHGDPSDLQDYKGGRDLASLKKFAGELGPQCGPANLDICDEEKKEKIKEYQAMGAKKREEFITEKDTEMQTLESDFKAFVEGLQTSYEEANKKKEADTEAIKAAGLGLLKSVHAHEKKSGKAEL